MAVASSTIALPARTLPDAATLTRALSRLALLAAIGVELAVLAAFLPATLDHFVHGPVADFHNLYAPARDLQLIGLYSPALTPLLFPLAHLPEMLAFRIFFTLSAAAVLAMAYVAQRHLTSPEARVAAALAVIALPQMHWALRLGHLTPLLALAAVAAFLLLERHPRVAAVAFAALTLKPQYAVAPFLYLLWQRRFGVLGGAVVVGAAAAAAGLAAVGPSSVADFWSLLVDWGPDSSDNLLPVQQSWMYSWPGVQVSLGLDPNPLLTADLLLLSLATACLAWRRTGPATGAAVTVLAMLPLTPYAQFYDATLLTAAFVLLARTNLAETARLCLICGLFAIAVITQANTIFPNPDLLGDAQTGGVFWLTPALVAVVAMIALLSRRLAPDPAKDGA
ncbi:MAG: glycosyltransferase 87 family protein [Dehalococcoidia bacterium]